MNDSDRGVFLEFMNTISDYYGKPKLGEHVLEIYFNGLREYSFDQVKGATSKHMTSSNGGQYMPKISDIKKHIDGGMFTHDEVLSAARLKNTPMGILCRIQIGTYDLEHQTDMFYLKQRAQECLDKMDEWKARAVNGDYTDHEVFTMLKHEVNPEKPFHTGLQPPVMSQENKNRCKGIYMTKIRDKPNEEVLAISKDEQNTVSNEGRLIISRILNEVSILDDKGEG